MKARQVKSSKSLTKELRQLGLSHDIPLDSEHSDEESEELVADLPNNSPARGLDIVFESQDSKNSSESDERP